MGVFTHGPGQIYNTKRAINSLKDLEGLKIRVGGGLVNDVAKALGTVPMLKPAPEAYELLSQGVADGLFFPKKSVLSFKLVPLIKHVTYVPGGLYNVTFAMIMNEAKWKSISAADQAAIEKLSGEALALRAGKAWDAVDARAVQAVRDAKIPIVTASPQFVAEIKAQDRAAGDRPGTTRSRPRAATARRCCRRCEARSPRCRRNRPHDNRRSGPRADPLRGLGHDPGVVHGF